jgi:hypothetical protein
MSKGFAGKVGSRARESSPALHIDTDALLGKASEAERAPTDKEPERPRGGRKPVQRDRIGKQAIGGFFDKAVKKQFAILSAELEKDKTALLAEAINDLFRKYNKPPTA